MSRAEVIFDTVIASSAMAVLFAAMILAPVLMLVAAVVLFVTVCLVVLVHDPNGWPRERGQSHD